MGVLPTILRVLTFKITQPEMLQFNRRHLAAGLIGTWLVGMGRYWDDPGATLLQHLGLGSVIYVFLLSALIWLLVKPLYVSNSDYRTVLTFVSLTSFPAILYAIPVENFTYITTANRINVWFLAIVASWRLALLYSFLQRFSQLGFVAIVTVTLLPVTLIITALTMLNLHRVVFNIMGGVRNPTPHDAAYDVLIFLTGISAVLVFPLLISYASLIYQRRMRRKTSRL